MDNFEDYYDVLGVNHKATFDDIKKAYRDKSWIFAEDRMEGAPESAKKKAGEEHKKINIAFETLNDPIKRAAYDKVFSRQDTGSKSSKEANFITQPKPIVDPPLLQFKNVKPGWIKKASFLVINTGGSYSKIWIDNPDSWLRVTNWRSLSSSDELPLKVYIEAQGKDWSKTYSQNVRVRLDAVETQLKVELRTQLFIKDHKWHDIDYDDLKGWVKKRKDRLDTGEELKGKFFRYRLNKNTRKYQVRLRYNHNEAVYDPMH